MKETGILIQKGLETPKVKEDKMAWGAVREGDVVAANVVGLALIGRVGPDKAVALFDEAYSITDAEGEEKDPAPKEIYEAIGLSREQCEDLVMAHFTRTARDIAEQLVQGREMAFD